MKKFLAIYHDTPEAMEQMASATDAQKAEVMNLWMQWKANNEHHVVDFGAPLMPGTLMGGAKTAGTVSGYSVLQAESLEAVKEACKDHPHPDIELLEFVAM